MVDMLFQYAPTSIKNVIDILKKAKRKYGDIPVAGFNGGGFHITVEMCDKPVKDLGHAFIWGPSYPVAKGVRQHRRKKNPDGKYIWFWD